MKSIISFPFRRRILAASALLAATCAQFAVTAYAGDFPALLDDFSDAHRTTTGAPRFIVTDKEMGSQSQAAQTCENGTLIVRGKLLPGRGLPAFVSVPLLLSAGGKPGDLTGYEGVRLRVKVLKGPLSVQVASADVQNFDFHSGVVVAKRGEIREVRLPFKDLKRAWSETTALNLKTITSVNLVAFGMAREEFVYEVDEIGFY